VGVPPLAGRVGRHSKEITLSAHLRLAEDRNYGQVIEDAAVLGAEGLDLAIVYLPPPHDPAVLEPLAEAIRDSGFVDLDNTRIRLSKRPAAYRLTRAGGHTAKRSSSSAVTRRSCLAGNS
jgi:hypothetical protein